VRKRPVNELPFAARWALRAYPDWWRERYGQDQEMFLADLAREGRALRGAVVDLIVGALRARLRPAGMPQSVPAWRDRTRASIAWATVPAMAGLVLVTVITQHSFLDSAQGGSLTALSTGGRVATEAMSALALAPIVLGICLLVGWALVQRLADRAPRGRAGRRWLLLVTAPFAGGVIEIGVSLLRAKLSPHTFVVSVGSRLETVVLPGGHPLAASFLSTLWDVFALASLFSVFCVVLAARRADLQVSDLRGGVWLAQFTALVLFLVALTVVAWGIGVTHQAPFPPADRLGIGPGIRPWAGVQTSIAAEWPLISACLVAISLVAARAAITARRSYKVARQLLVLGA